MLKSTSLLAVAGLLSCAAFDLGCSSSNDTSGSGAGTAASTASTGATGSTTSAASTGSGKTTSASTGSGVGGSGGSGGGDNGPHSPIDAPNDKWTFVPIAGSVCMNNTATGIGINKSSTSDDVVIYMEGGNACFNAASCDITYNPNGYGETEFAGDVSGALSTPKTLFDRTSSIVKDYNFIYIPYCTGDVHAGDNDTMVGGKMRYFHGANNMALYLERLVATFPKAKNIVLSGSSAGGFGAAFNYDRVAKAFPQVKVMLIDDSGPPMGSDFVPTCFQKAALDTWGLAKTLPAGCTDCAPPDGVFMEPLVKYLATTYSDRRLALVSSTQDGTISKFWAFGEDNCKYLQTYPPDMYPGTEYQAGLEDLRDRIIGKSSSNFKMFLIDGTDGGDDTQHVWLAQDPATVKSNGTTLADWLPEMLDGDAKWANVPLTGP